MARPQFQAPKFPTQDSPSEAGSGKCGSSYHIQYEVRAPYKSADKYSNTLPAAYGKTEIGQSDIKDSLPAVLEESFHSALYEAIKGASEILHSYDKDGYIDASNKALILGLISRANKYKSQAKEIRTWWEEVYRPDSEVSVYGWPLGDDNVRGCTSFAPNKGSVYMSLPGQGPTGVEFTCPTTDDKALHDADQVAYQQLLYAAILSARCAQEAAATVGTYNRNKEFLESISGGMGLATAPPKTGPGGRITTDIPTSDHPKDPEPEDEPETESASKPKKKKDNTLLIAGAAGLGFLLLKGRK